MKGKNREERKLQKWVGPRCKLYVSFCKTHVRGNHHFPKVESLHPIKKYHVGNASPNGVFKVPTCSATCGKGNQALKASLLTNWGAGGERMWEKGRERELFKKMPS